MIKEDNQEITKEVINDFLIFLESQEDYLDSGLGAFHTDNHSNW